MPPTSRPPTRTFIRVGLFWIGYLVVLLVMGLLKGMLPPAGWRDLAWGGCSAAMFALLTLGFERWDTGRTSDIAFDGGTAIRFLIGLAVGAAIVAINLAIVRVVVGPIRVVVNPQTGLAAVVIMAITFIALSCMEELGFRGYPLRALTSALGTWPAVVITAVAFGLSHLAFGWPVSAVVLGVIPSGVLFGVAASASGGLAMPVGVHAAVNMALWSVGAKETPGLWTVIIPPALQARNDALSPYLGVVTVLVLATLTWRLRSRLPAALRHAV